MNAFLTLMIALSVWLGTFIPAHAEWAQADMNNVIDQTNFMANEGCSGTLISVKSRYILTANHCVADQYETITRETVGDDGEITKETGSRLRDGTVSQYSFEGSQRVVTTTYKVKVVAVDKNRDLALLQIVGDIPNTRQSVLACDDPIRGDRVFIVGNPRGVLYSSVVSGIVSSLQRDYHSLGFDRGDSALDHYKPLMQVSGGVIGGNSGGAVYNAHGQLIGVPVLANQINEILGFAVPIDDIRGFLADNDIDKTIYACSDK